MVSHSQKVHSLSLSVVPLAESSHERTQVANINVWTIKKTNIDVSGRDKCAATSKIG